MWYKYPLLQNWKDTWWKINVVVEVCAFLRSRAGHRFKLFWPIQPPHNHAPQPTHPSSPTSQPTSPTWPFLFTTTITPLIFLFAYLQIITKDTDAKFWLQICVYQLYIRTGPLGQSPNLKNQNDFDGFDHSVMFHVMYLYRRDHRYRSLSFFGLCSFFTQMMISSNRKVSIYKILTCDNFFSLLLFLGMECAFGINSK